MGTHIGNSLRTRVGRFQMLTMEQLIVFEFHKDVFFLLIPSIPWMISSHSFANVFQHFFYLFFGVYPFFTQHYPLKEDQ